MPDKIEIAEIVLNAKATDLSSPELERKIEITVKNQLIEDLRIQVRPIPETTPDNAALGENLVWLSVPEQLQVFVLKTSEPRTISIDVKLPASARRGKTYSFHVLVSSDRLPESEFSQTSPISIELLPKREQKIPWLWLAVGAGVLALGTFLALFLTRGLSPGDLCKPENATSCPVNAACNLGVGRCAAENGGACELPEQCLSNKCSDEHVCSPLVLGDECLLLASAACGPNLTCTRQAPPVSAAAAPAGATPVAATVDSATALEPKALCLSNSQGPCTKAADCVRGACVKGVCGLGVGQAGCESDAQCPPDQKCYGAGAQKSCLLRPGQNYQPRLCTVDHSTDAAKCAPDDGTCAAPGDCKAPLNCTPQKMCLLPLGAACTAASECGSGNCQTVCTAPVRTCPNCTGLCISGTCVLRLDVIAQSTRRLEAKRIYIEQP